MSLNPPPGPHLFMFVLGHITAVDEEDLVTLIQARNADVRGGVGGHTGHNDWHALVSSPLKKHTHQHTLV